MRDPNYSLTGKYVRPRLKKCHMCGELKDVATEYWEHPHTRDGAQPSCKSCQRTANTDRRRVVRAEAREAAKAKAKDRDERGDA